MNKVITINDNVTKKITTKIQTNNNHIFKTSYLNIEKTIEMITFFKSNIKMLRTNDYIQDKEFIYFLINDEKSSIFVGKTKDAFNRSTNMQYNRIIVLCSDEWTSTILEYLEYWFINLFVDKQLFGKTINKRIEKEPKFNSKDDEIINEALKHAKWLLLNEGINIDNSKPFVVNDNKKHFDIHHHEVYCEGVKAFYFPQKPRKKKLLLIKGTELIWNKFDPNDYNENSLRSLEKYNNFFESNKITKINENKFILNNDFETSLSFGATLVHGYFSCNGHSYWKGKNNKHIDKLK